MHALSLVSILLSGLAGAVSTILFQEIIPNKVKYRLKLKIREIKAVLFNTRIRAKFIWKYNIINKDINIKDIDEFSNDLKRRIAEIGLNTKGTYTITAEKQGETPYYIEISINFIEDEQRLLSVQVTTERELSLRHFERDILVVIDDPIHRKLLSIISETLEKYSSKEGRVSKYHLDRFMELHLRQLSSLSLLTEDLGIRLALVDSKYKLLIGRNDVSLRIEGFTEELLGLLRMVALLFA